MNKQTAVSQIFVQMKAARKDTKFWNDSMLVDWLLESEERFKQMEKEQIIKTAQDNFYAGQDLANGYKIDWDSSEQYYNETYGGQDEK
jgi:hypothetical protein